MYRFKFAQDHQGRFYLIGADEDARFEQFVNDLIEEGNSGIEFEEVDPTTISFTAYEILKHECT